MKKINIQEYIGKVYGRLTILKESSPSLYKYKYVHKRHNVVCKCSCGSIGTFDLGSVVRGHTTSCGCYNIEACKRRATKHGLAVGNGRESRKPEYDIWLKMRARCENPKDHDYVDYGGRGIKICDRWKESPLNFIEDVGERPSPEYSIERIDVNGNYEPSNCKWILKTKQSQNTRKSIRITFRGEEKCLSEWCKILNLNYGIMRFRVSDMKIPFEIAKDIPKKVKLLEYLKKHNIVIEPPSQEIIS